MARAEQAEALTVLSALRPGAAAQLRVRFWARALQGSKNVDLELLAFIQSARWVVLNRLPGAAPGGLRHDYLLFESNFNGTFDAYIDAFSLILGERMEKIWGSSYGFPGAQPVGPFKDYIRRHRYAVQHYFAAYPQASAKAVATALRARDGLAALPVRFPERLEAAVDALLVDLAQPWHRRPPAPPPSGLRAALRTTRVQTPVTVLAPVRKDQGQRLKDLLESLPSDPSPLSSVGGVHFARWVVLDRLPYDGGGQQPDPVLRPYLLYTATVDGDVGSHLRQVARLDGAAAVWECCDGWPGPGLADEHEQDRRAGYLQRYARSTSFHYSPCPGETVEAVRDALTAPQRLDALARDLRGRSLQAARAPAEAEGSPAVDLAPGLAEVQGNVLLGYGRRHRCAGYVFLQLPDPDTGRRWLRELLPRVRYADHSRSLDVALNVGFTAAGLRALGLPADQLATFPEAFRQGMRARAHDLLGDAGADAPEHWEPPYDGDRDGDRDRTRIHVVCVVSGTSRPVVEAEVRSVLAAAADVRLLPVGDDTDRRDFQLAELLEEDREHFGWIDGTSQPGVAGVHTEARAGQGAWHGEGRWELLQPGEFVLGHVDEEGQVAAVPQPPQLGRNGTYLALRKLSQDVAAFSQMVEDAASAAAATGLDISRELLQAKIVGRWRDDGTPLALHDRDPAPRLPVDPVKDNTFAFGDDPLGHRCPLGSHIRRANPRDSLPFDGRLVNRHRLIRRGLPYGSPVGDGAPQEDRGLVFACYQADLERQFEFVQGQWLRRGDALGLPDQDPLLGDGATLTIETSSRPHVLPHLRRCVTVRGGDYFFLPSRSGLRHLTELEGGGTDDRG